MSMITMHHRKVEAEDNGMSIKMIGLMQVEAGDNGINNVNIRHMHVEEEDNEMSIKIIGHMQVEAGDNGKSTWMIPYGKAKVDIRLHRSLMQIE